MNTKRNLIQICLLVALLLVLPAVVQAQQGSTLTNITSFKPFVGLGYSPFTGSETPMNGNFPQYYPTVDQITSDIKNVAFLATEITTYAMDGTLSNIAGICNTYNIKCYPCAYVSTGSPADTTNELNA